MEPKGRRVADRRPPVEERRPQSLSKIVFEDLREVSLKGTFREGLREIYRFYLDEDHRAEVEQLGAVRRAFVVTGWLIRGLLLKLSPPRRPAPADLRPRWWCSGTPSPSTGRRRAWWWTCSRGDTSCCSSCSPWS
jgi:hypothetical protein